MPQNMVEWLLCWRKATFLLKTLVVQVQVQDKPVFPHDSHSFTLDTLSQYKTSNFSVSSYGLYVISSLHQPIPMYNVRSWDVRVLDDGVDDRFIAVQKDFLTKFCTKNSLLVSSFQISTPICLILSSSITSWLETNSIWNIDWLFCISSTEITVDSRIRTLRKEGFSIFSEKYYVLWYFVLFVYKDWCNPFLFPCKSDTSLLEILDVRGPSYCCGSFHSRRMQASHVMYADAELNPSCGLVVLCLLIFFSIMY
jgi:hypothetical protein